MKINRNFPAGLATAALFAQVASAGSTDHLAFIETVTVSAGDMVYPMPGEFLRAGRPAAATFEARRFDRVLEIMKYQVSLADYGRCVDAGACSAPDAKMAGSPDAVPVTGVNYLDATAYAAWYSRLTGENWRLPTDAEWAHVAAERFTGESYTTGASDPANPAIAWIRRYKEEAALRREPDPIAHRRGHFGPNSRGVEDLAGNVWEWTSTCYSRTILDGEGGAPSHQTENCNVHIAEGRHRAYMSDFVRDGVSGGCAVGTPPDNLGFRLVRDGVRSALPRLLDMITNRLFGS